MDWPMASPRRLLPRRRFATLLDLVKQYNKVFKLDFTPGEMNDLVEYQKSLGGTKSE